MQLFIDPFTPWVWLGIAAMTAWSIEDIRVANVGDSFEVGAYEVTLEDVRREQGPNYVTTMGQLRIAKDGREVVTLLPEKRFYPVAGMPTTEAAIDNSLAFFGLPEGTWVDLLSDERFTSDGDRLRFSVPPTTPRVLVREP